jgi:hypothetical protein
MQLITYPALGLCPPGDAHKLVERGDNTVSAAVLGSCKYSRASHIVWR